MPIWLTHRPADIWKISRTAPARLLVNNLARRSSLKKGSKRKKGSEGEWRNVRKSVWKFGTGNRKCR